MNPFQSIILGIVQGLTEFIPVSSSGHLQLVPSLIGWQTPSLIFILFTNFGTLLALIIYFRQDLIQFIQAGWVFLQHKFHSPNTENAFQIKLITNILLATIPAGVIGLIVEKSIDKFYTLQTGNSPALLTAVTMILVGVLLVISKYIFDNQQMNLRRLGYLQAFSIGLAQALAFIRGVSRSGITILSGGFLGLDLVSAAKFSFLMSIPISLATSLLAVKDLFSLPDGALQTELVSSMLGMVTAFVSGYFAIKFLLDFLKKRGLAIFGWYRIAFGLLAILIVISK